jgi:hypothetical protein
MEGFPDDYVSVNAKNNPGMITRLRRMGNDLAGTENALAIYIIQNPRWKHNPGTFIPERMAGIVWLAHMPAGRDVMDYLEDNQYDVGWPINAPSFEKTGPFLKDLIMRTYGPTGKGDLIWKRMRGSMTGGGPVDLTKEPYRELGDALTDYYKSAR